MNAAKAENRLKYIYTTLIMYALADFQSANYEKIFRKTIFFRDLVVPENIDVPIVTRSTLRLLSC